MDQNFHFSFDKVHQFWIFEVGDAIDNNAVMGRSFGIYSVDEKFWCDISPNRTTII